MADCPLDRISAKHVKMLRDRKAATPEAANTRLKALRSLFKWALADDDIAARFQGQVNPARDVARLRIYSAGHHTWTPEEVAQFESAHAPGSTARLALALLLFTGQRKSDVIAFGRQHVKDGWLHFTQFKNRNRRPVTLDLPILPGSQPPIFLHRLNVSHLGNRPKWDTIPWPARRESNSQLPDSKSGALSIELRAVVLNFTISTIREWLHEPKKNRAVQVQHRAHPVQLIAASSSPTIPWPLRQCAFAALFACKAPPSPDLASRRSP
jgi:hypothetical protein